jgi:hypothetical protein
MREAPAGEGAHAQNAQRRDAAQRRTCQQRRLPSARSHAAGEPARRRMLSFRLLLAT